MNNLTLLYCTASLIDEETGEKIRQNLLQVTEGKYPIISVSQKPIDFGQNICVGKTGQSCYNFFKQILIGARKVKTKYIAHVDDDSLYVPEHFTHRPSSENHFIYNTNTWFAGSKIFWRQKDMSGMFCHICPTKALFDNLAPRFTIYPIEPTNQRRWGEPGKFDTFFGIPNATVETFATKLPLATFEYRGSLNGKRKRFGLKNPNNYCEDLEPFGNARTLQKEYWDHNSMLGKWNQWYNKIKHGSSFQYNKTATYQMAADFLAGLSVEDWGCGVGAFKKIHQGNCVNIDGTHNPYVDKVKDLRNYQSNVEGIMMRHVIEHNYDWGEILTNAINSFTKRFCLVLFTPFTNTTRVIYQNKKDGVDVPVFSFSEKDIEHYLEGLQWKLIKNIKTRTFYGIEHIYFVEK